MAYSVHAQIWTCGRVLGTLQASRLTATSVATASAAGFDFNMSPEESAPACTSSHTFYFSAPVPEGNYLVTLVLGGSAGSETTVKAEARRLMLLRVRTRPHQRLTESFLVNVRRAAIADDGHVKLKPREIGSLDWDNKLTLEFSGKQPSVHSIRIEHASANAPTVYLAGDSTVVDQEHEPWAAWGQMLPVFFDSKIAIANEAESGETIGSFESEHRFAKIFSTIKRGDFLFMQFAHNDQKPGRGYISPARYTELLTKYIGEARAKGATPVLVTSMNRRTFDGEGHVTDSLAPYPQTMRAVAAQEKVALIDLNLMSRTLYESLGKERSKTLFVYAKANSYPGQTAALHDGTHFNNYGAYELARCVVLGIQQDNLPLVKFLRYPHSRFNPARADSVEGAYIPPSLFVEAQKPYER